jgi:hypothetical protein
MLLIFEGSQALTPRWGIYSVQTPGANEYQENRTSTHKRRFEWKAMQLRPMHPDTATGIICMDSINALEGPAARPSRLEDRIFETLAAVMSTPPPPGAGAALGAGALGWEAFERGDVRSTSTTPDDGGERLSAAPAATELSGQAQHAWGPQASEFLMRAQSRQWSSSTAQQSTLMAEASVALSNGADSHVPSVVSGGNHQETVAAPLLTSGDVRNGQAAGVLDWDRFKNSLRSNPAR